MDLYKILEIGGTVIVTIGAIWVKDVVTKATTKQRVLVLEESFKDFKSELRQFHTTLSDTNQSIASLNATVKGLAHWLERTEDRLNNL